MFFTLINVIVTNYIKQRDLMKPEAYTDDQFTGTLNFLNAKDLYSAATAKEVANTLNCHFNTAKTRLNELVEAKQIHGMMHGLTYFYWIKEESL